METDRIQPDRFYSARELSRISGIGIKVILAGKAKETLPAFIAPGSEIAKIRGADFLEWVTSRPVRASKRRSRGEELAARLSGRHSNSAANARR